MSQRGRGRGAGRHGMEIDSGNASGPGGEPDQRDGEQTNRSGESADGAQERVTRGEGAKKRLEECLEEFRSLVPAELWVRVLSAARKYCRLEMAVGENARGSGGNEAPKLGAYNGDMTKLAGELTRTCKVKVARVRAREPRRSPGEAGRPRSQQLLVEVHTVEEANTLIGRGVVMDYAIYPCERYEPTARAVICFRCGAWGHKAAYCKAEGARCLLCACAAHAQEGAAREREARCPVKLNPAANKPKCINCNGQHPAFDASCRVAKEQRQRAWERFLDRPLAFQAPLPINPRASGPAHSRGYNSP
ncbi:hypothetical protein MFIFM68171_09727 [Madurella fahalii]|uniref:CCHC-type domain-containing protein n=1 Tax=Madurella fahalii TaxID=1157608 RepID=A0ABQ0GP53_9PEZI